MLHFKYIDPIRNKKGKLRCWSEYDKISRLENMLDFHNHVVSDLAIEHKHKKYFKNDQRKRLQKPL